MKKHVLLLSAGLSLIALKGYGQAIPNGSFETWNSTSVDVPTGFMTSNDESLRKIGQITATKTNDVHGGTAAIKLMTLSDGKDTAGAYFANSRNDPMKGEGGMPYAALPTAITGYYKYYPAGSDSALILVVAKKSGSVIGLNLFKLGGVVGNYTQFSFPLTIAGTPDSIILAAASSDLFSTNGVPGSRLYLDDLAFTGSGSMPAIPNGDFESWTTQTIDMPAGWSLMGESVTKSTTAYRGNYAAQLTNFTGDSGRVYANGISTGKDRQNGPPSGGNPYTRMVDTLFGYYKYTAGAPGDSAAVMVTLSKNGTPIGGNFASLPPVSTYTLFQMPVLAFTAPDSIRVDIFSSNFSNAKLGSTLIIDEVQLKSQKLHTGIEKSLFSDGLIAYPNPATEKIYFSAKGMNAAGTVLQITNTLGDVVIEKRLNAGTSEVSLNGLRPGMYFYRAGDISGKFMKQ